MRKAAGKIHETALHIGIMHMLRLDFLPADLIVAHPPNGGWREKREAAKLKAMGVLPGLSDLLCWWPIAIEEEGVKSVWLDSGFIEIKTPVGELDAGQIEFRRRVKAMGGKYEVARNYETVRGVLIGWGVKCQNRVRL